MKHVFLAIAAVLAVFVISGCNKDNTPEEVNTLYTDMLSYAEQYSVAVNEQLSSSKTKSNSESSSEISDFTPDLSCIDEKFLKYIDQYSLPENINDWDEMSILMQVNADPCFSSKEKDVFVQSIAVAYYLKNEFSDVVTSTKADAKECEEQFYTDIKRATRNAALGAIFAIGSGVFGELAVLVYYYVAIDDAEEDYNKCMAQ